MFKVLSDSGQVWMQGQTLWTMIGLVILTIAIMFGLPKLTKKLPEALIAILLVSVLVIFGNLEVATVGSFVRGVGGEGLKGGLPQLQWAIFEKIPFNLKTRVLFAPVQ